MLPALYIYFAFSDDIIIDNFQACGIFRRRLRGQMQMQAVRALLCKAPFVENKFGWQLAA